MQFPVLISTPHVITKMTRPLTASGTISHPECFEYVKNGHTCVVRIGHFSGPVQVQMNCPEYIASLNGLLHQVL